MNRIYRLVWNRALGTVQVASELAHAPRGGTQGTSDTPLPRNRALAMACATALGLALSFTPVLADASCSVTAIASVTGMAGTAGAGGTNGVNGGTGSSGANGGDAAAAGSSQAFCVDTGSQVVGGTGGTAGYGGDGLGIAGKPNPAFGGNGGTGGNGGYGIRGTGAFQLGNYGSMAGGAGGNGGGGGEGAGNSTHSGYSGNGGNGGAGGAALSGNGFTLINMGTGVITGGAGGVGGHAGFRAPHWGNAGAGGQGGAAINSTGTSNISNSGNIVGGAGGRGGEGYNGIGLGGTGGAGIAGSGFVLNNTASIAGGAGGAGGYAFANGTSGNGGTGGAGILGSNLTITNAGSISGGQAGAAGNTATQKTPGKPGTSGDAVHFTGGSSTLTLQSGSALNGVVEIDSGSTATIDANAGGLDLNGGTLGSNALIVNGTANVNVNTPSFTISGNINGSGTLTIAGTGNTITLGAVNIGALTSEASTTLGNNVTSNGGGQTFNNAVSIANNVTLSDNQNGNIVFGSTIDGSHDLTISTAGLSTFEGAIGGTAALNNITVASDGIQLNQSWNIGGTATLTSTGAIAEATNATLSASLLTGSSTGSTTLDTATNAIQQIGSFSAKGFSLVNSQSLAVITGSTLDGGTGDVSLSTTSGNLSVNQGATVKGANITLAPNGFTNLSGTLSATGTITSNSLLQVETGSAIVGNLANNSGISFVNSSTITLAGVISGGGDVTLQNGSSVAFQGVNTYTGGTTIDSGSTLQLGSGGTSGSVVGDIIDNGTLAFDHSDAVSLSNHLTGTGSLVQQGTGTLTLSGNNVFSGGVQINAGTLVLESSGAIGTGAVSMAPGTTVTFAALGLSIANNFSLSGDPTFDVPTGQTDTISGVIADGSSPGTLEKTDGGTLVLTATNTYSGSTNIDGGTLALTGTGSIANSSGVNVSSGATFDITGANGGASITSLSGGGSVNIGTGTLTLTNASGTFSGAISDGGERGNLTLDGGTETLTAYNPIFGVTTINGGTLVLSGAGGIFHSSDVDIAAGGTLDVSGASTAQFDSLDGSGKVNLGSQMLTLTNASGTFSGVLSGGGDLSLVAGSETLSGANTYTGTTFVGGGGVLTVSNATTLNNSSGLRFDNGTLQLNNTNLPGSLPITLYAGGGTLVFNESSAGGTISQGQISGSGGLTIENTNQFVGLTLTNGSNSYQGGTTIYSTSGNSMLVTVEATGALGSGNVTIGQGGYLQFVGSVNSQVTAGSQTINLTAAGSTLDFSPNSSAGLATINMSGGNTNFDAGSDAGHATINVGANSTLMISSTADAATIQNSGQTASTLFEPNATAGNASIQNTGLNASINFFGASTAGNATITNSGKYATLDFGTGSSAGNATITNSNGGATSFYDADAGSATLTSDSASSITLNGSSSAANATFVNNGKLYIQGFQNATITPSIGSLSGSGNVYLGSNYNANSIPVPFTLTLGGLNQNDIISGVIADNYNAPRSVGDSLAKIGTGTLTLSGNNTFSGGVQIDAGAVATSNNGALGTGSTSMATGTTLDFAADGLSLANGFGLSGTANFDVASGQTGTIAGIIGDGTTAGTLRKIDAGTLVLTAANLYSGGTTISDGTLSVSSDANLGAATGAVTLDGGTLQINGNTYTGTNRTINLTGNGGVIDIADAANAFTVSQSINSNGHLAVSGAGTLLLTGTDRFGGGITIDNSTLQIGNGGNNGAIASDIVDNGTLVFNENNGVIYSNAMSGNGNLIQQGAGTLTLYGSNSSAFTGTTTVANGTLQVGYSPANNATLGGNVLVNAGATLGGFGTIGGNVTVQSGGNVTPGSLTGTLTVNGNFTATPGSVLNLFLGAPGANFQTFGTGPNLQVNGNLTLNGLTLNAYSSSMGPGIYNLFTYGGTLSESNGGIVLGSMPAGQAVQLQNLTASKQINLIDTTGYTLNMWNANGQASATQMGGGSGIWSTTSAMWTNSDGSVPNTLMQPQPGFAVFGGALGMVTIDDSAGAVSVTSMQFYSTGYLLKGDPLQLVSLVGGNATINVGDGTAASANTTATINSVLTGSVGLLKTDYGTLVLGGANTYSGATTIQQGTLALANNGSIANTPYVEVDSGAIFDISSTAHGASIPWLQGNGTVSLGTQTLALTGAGRFDGFIQGSGGLTLTNGITQLTGSNAYTGTTAIDPGAELDLLNNGSIADSTVNVLTGGTLSLILTNTGSMIGSLQGTGYVDTGLPSQTLTLTNAADTFNGVIGGYGALAVSSGTETLTGANTYTGLTTIKGGTLALSGSGNIADSYSVTINSGGTLDISATNGGASVTELAGIGNVNLGAQTLTITNAGSQFYGSINGSGNLTVDAGNLLLYGANTYTGSTTINAGAYVTSENARALTNTTAFDLNGGELDVMSSSLTTSAAVTLGAGSNTIGVAAPYTVQLDGPVSGSGGLALIGLGGGSLILTNGNNSYQGGTTISNQLGGVTTLEVKATGAMGTGDVTVGASSALDFIGTSGNLVSAGSRTINVDNSGNISFGNDSTLGSVTLNMASGAQGTIGGASIGDAHINNNGEVTIQDANAGHAVLTNVSSGLFAFLGNNDMSSATVVNNAGSAVFVSGIAGDNSTLSIGSLSGGGGVLLGTNADANNNPLPLTLTLGALNQNDTIGGVIDDSAINNGVSVGDSVTKIGTGTLTLTGTNTYTGITTVSSGSLQLGNGGTSGSVAGNIEDDATLVFNRSDAVNYGGTISGNGAIIQQGAGSVTLDGNNSAFSGTTTVAGGSLVVGSMIGNGATLGGNVLVDNGATLSGLGTIGGDVSVQSGGIVTPGTAFGVLTVNGNFTAAQNSVLNESFGAPTANFHTYGSGTSVQVNGDLTLNGVILNVTDAGGMGPGIYNVFSYGGTLSESNGGITLGSTPAGQTLQLQNLASSKQINLIDTSGLTLDIWNANGQATSSQIGGGSGIWSVTSQMWTDANADTPNVAIQPQPGFAVFGGTAGTVTVDDRAGNVSAAGLQFDVGGYTLTGDTLTLAGSNGSAPVIRVGDGSSAGSSMIATIDNVLAGNAGLVKSDLGTLVLAGNNTYTGDTTINGGTLQIGHGGSSGWIVGNVVNHGALVFDRSDAVSFAGVISGSGSLGQSGAGTLTLTGAETYTGSTAINAGTLALSGNGSIASSSGVGVAHGASFDISAASNGASIASLSGGGSVNLGNQILTLTQASGNFGGVISGNGGVTLASGTQTLSGANTYTGSTTIDSNATLTLAGSLASGSVIDHGVLNVSANAAGASMANLGGDGVVVLGSTLTLGSGSFSGTIKGTGTLVLTGGDTTLTGVNTYSGGTAIDNGTLSVASDASLGATSGALSFNGGTLNISGHAFTGTARAITLGSNGGALDIADAGNTFTLGQSLSGSGALGKAGAGTLVLIGNSSYGGGTSISAGTLQLGNGGTTGSVTGNIANNGMLVFDRSDAVSFDGVISGSGSLTKQGNGSLTLTGANSYTGVTSINAGTLQIGNGGSSGAVAGNIVNDGTLIFDRSDAVTFSGVMAGNGLLNQNGTGTLVLNGNSRAFTGTTTVQNGTLEVGDAATPSAYLGGNVAVNGGATLRGHGSIGGNVSNAGTVWAGGSIGTLTVQGNYTQTASGTLEVEATPDGQASLLSVNGTASLAGSALVLADNGNWLARSSYTILSAAGGISGQFASTRNNLVFLTPTLSYGAEDVTLTLQRNNINFNAVAQTRNQFAVASSLNALSYGNAIYDALLLSNAATARTALNQISGEIHASVRTAIMDDGHDVRDAVTNHLLDWTQDTGGQAGQMDNGTSVWTAATARGGSHRGDGNASTLDANGGGMLLGMDTPIGDRVRAGGMIGTGNLSDSVGALDSSAHVHTRHAGLYASLQSGSFQLMGGAFYGWQNVNTDRNVAFSSVNGVTTSRYSANTVQAYVDGSYVFTLGHGTLAPFVDVAAQRLHTDAFSEAGSAAALSGQAQNSTQTYGTLGLRGVVQLDAQGMAQAHASLGWQHAWGDTQSTASMQLASGSNAFTVQGVPVARDAMAISAGFRFLATPRLSFDATYNGQFAHRVNDQAAHVSLSYSF